LDTSTDGSAFTKAFSNGWVRGLGCAFLLALAGLIAAIVTHTQVEAAAVAVGTSGVLAFLVVAAVVTTYQKK
jgi:hypothetical protein